MDLMLFAKRAVVCDGTSSNDDEENGDGDEEDAGEWGVYWKTGNFIATEEIIGLGLKSEETPLLSFSIWTSDFF
ncbi:hypothetical protein L1987_33478 [Smallanthus sonchifolius]|uniref:Uncharacterized protein n=1 Tax=Smallanthus sonchifolius TaxID=185202 RepID=A0ACB9HRY9_9ASTR|nr:hypothetical protein L1987_33478 [Smallanthus sonchifolius]